MFNYFKQIPQKFASLDFVGYRPKLLYRGLEYVQTFLGGVISTLAVFFMVGFGLYFFIQFFERQDATVTMNTAINDFPEYNMSKLPFIFKLVDGNSYDVANDTTVYNWWGLVSGANPFTFVLEPCNISNPKHFGKYAEFYKDVLNISSCVDDINKYNFDLYGLYEENDLAHSFINIVLQMCQNTTGSKVICKPQILFCLRFKLK